MKYGLIGERLGHSFSAEIHKQLAGYDYELLELAPEEISEFLKKRDFCGINVTIPYKQTVMEHLDYIAPEALKIGAVNTIVNRNGKLYGYNTDFSGMRCMLERFNISIKGKKIAVLGTGGTSKTACAVLQSMDAGEILVVSRSENVGAITYEKLYSEHLDTEVIINTTPVGMFPNLNGCPVKLEQFKSLCAVADVIYNPINTNFVLSGKKLKVSAAGGLYMLVAQAAFAAGLFLNSDFSKKIEDVYASIYFSKQNIVLIGMPGSGKTTIGKLVAQRLSKQFVDTDEIITEKISVSISEFFEKHSEAEFRKIEAEVIDSLSGQSGLVVATGGGAVLRQENINALAKNGWMVFLDCPLSDLVATKDRPLSSSPEMLKKRFEERYPIYKAAADLVLPVSRDASKNADALLLSWKEGLALCE